MGFVQVERIEKRIERVKPGERPVVELQLEDNQRLVSIELCRAIPLRRGRKTIDWLYVAYVETRL